MKLGKYKVPYMNGNLLHYPERGWRYDGETWHSTDPEWRENEPFEAELALNDMRSGRSAKYVLWHDKEGHEFPMFVVDLLDLLKGNVVRYGVVDGRFAVRKRGQNYGLVFVGEDDG